MDELYLLNVKIRDDDRVIEKYLRLHGQTIDGIAHSLIIGLEYVNAVYSLMISNRDIPCDGAILDPVIQFVPPLLSKLL